jgi:hypothetical protein
VGGLAPAGDFRDVHNDLAAMRDLPVEVTRLRRAAHLAVWLGLLCLGPCWFFLILGYVPSFTSWDTYERFDRGEQALNDLDQAAAREFAASMLHPHPLLRLRAAVQWDQDRALRERLHETLDQGREEAAVRQASWSRFSRTWLGAGLRARREQLKQRLAQEARPRHPEEVRALAAGYAAPRDLAQEGSGLFRALAIATVIWPVVFVVWAFLWRGGLSYRWAGIALVRADGRPAARWHCACRALLFWLPPTALFLASAWLETHYWSVSRESGTAWMPRAAWALWWAGAAVFGLSAAPALWNPTRSWHDRLARTYLVPR